MHRRTVVSGLTALALGVAVAGAAAAFAAVPANLTRGSGGSRRGPRPMSGAMRPASPANSWPWPA